MSQARAADVRTLAGSPVGIGDQLILKSRVEQQSELIMMLKTHNDNMAREKRELQRSRDDAMETATQADRDRASIAKRLGELDGRFRQLSSNHQEMIKFLEGHKADKTRLSARVSELEGSLSRAADANAADQAARHAAELEAARGAAADAEAIAAAAREQTRRLEAAVTDAVAARAAADERIAAAEAAARRANTRADEACKGSAAHKAGVGRLEQLLAKAKAKAERLEVELATARAETNTVRAESSAVAKERDSIAADLDRLKAEAAAGGPAEFARLQKEYQAYKRHSTHLLEKEKEVNARLRHLGRQ